MDYVQRLPIVAFGFGVMPPFGLNSAKVDQVFGDIGMAISVELTIHHQHALIERVGNIQVTSIEVCVGQVGQGLGQIWRDTAGHRL